MNARMSAQVLLRGPNLSIFLWEHLRDLEYSLKVGDAVGVDRHSVVGHGVFVC